MFAFIAGIGDDNFESENEALRCYAYICPNRKVARKLTLTVAKSFQQAYEQWSKSEQRRKSIAESSIKPQVASEKRHQSESQLHDCDVKKIQQQSLLIDLNEDLSSGSASPEPPTNFFQNTWISFEDKPGSLWRILKMKIIITKLRAYLEVRMENQGENTSIYLLYWVC